MNIIFIAYKILIVYCLHTCANGGFDLISEKYCFCKLKGQINDCNCDIATVDYYNNVKIQPRLQSIILKDYFKFFQVNLKQSCPFWHDDFKCSMRYCSVEHCTEADIPEGLKFKEKPESVLMMIHKHQSDDGNSDCGDDLGTLNTTISASAKEEFALWQAHDDAQDNFCTLPDEDDDAEYVDLTLNEERYTGYSGPSAHRIWNSIYTENCFRPDYKPNIHYGVFIPSSHLQDMCLEKRVFYRLISGLHSSINIHLCANYLLSDRNSIQPWQSEAKWGMNIEEFRHRFSPEFTENEGPVWLQNLYFIYLLELKAIAKAAPYLEQELYYTGNFREDQETRSAIHDFLKVVKEFPEHFDETTMFTGGEETSKLKETFRSHFRNISSIMDCVGCEKCKLWGKLQIQGLGTALKILFSGKFDQKPLLTPKAQQFHLKRGEIVSLFNSITRLSSSISHLETFRNLLR